VRQQLPYRTTPPTQTHVRNTGIQLRTSVQKGHTCYKLNATASGLQRIGNGEVSIASLLRSLIPEVPDLTIRTSDIVYSACRLSYLFHPNATTASTPTPPYDRRQSILSSGSEKERSLKSSRNNLYLARVMLKVTSRFLLQFIFTLFLKLLTARNIRSFICKRPLH
jgi:hypothetical protein